MTAVSSSEALILRQPSLVKRYLSVCPRLPVFQATVTGVSKDTNTNGIYAITFDTVTLGNYTDARPGYTVDIGTTPNGDEKGRMRVRKSATSTTLYVNENSSGAVNVEVGDYITVREERMIWQRLPMLVAESSGGQFTDTFDVLVDYDISYTDEHENYRPIANIDGIVSGFVDDGQSYRTVRLDGSRSVALADGESIVSYQWDIVDGQLASGYSLTDPTIVATFPATRPFRYISLTVSTANSSSVRYFPIFVHSDAHPPLGGGIGFEVISDDTQDGREMVIELFGEPGGAGSIPEQTLIVYWEDTKFEGAPAPAPYRRQFIGWSIRSSTIVQAYKGTYQVTIGGPATWLKNLSGIQESFLSRTNPTEWYHMKDVTDDRTIASILRYRTTALEVCNLHLSGITYKWGQPDTSDFAAVKVDKGSIWDQIVRLAQEYSGLVKADTNGDIWLRQHPCLMVSGRDSLATTLTLTDSDWEDESPPEVIREFVRHVGQLEIDGFYWTGTESVPLRARAPGRTPSYGVFEENIVAQVLDPSSDTAARDMLKALAGHWYAWMNENANELLVTLIYNIDVFEPAFGEWVSINATINDVRGTNLSGRYFLKSVAIEHYNEPPYKTLRLTLIKETSGEPGEIVPIPESDVLPDDWDYPDDWYPYDWGWDIGTGFPGIAATSNSIAAFGDDSYLYRTADFTAQSPTWTRTLLNLLGTPVQFVVDAFSPGYLGTGTSIDGWIATNQAIYRITDIFGSPTISLQYSYGYTVYLSGYDWKNSIGLDASFGTQNHAVCVIPQQANCYGASKAIYTVDGTNWTAANITTYYSSGSMTLAANSVYVSPRSAGLVYATSIYDSQGRFAANYVSTNYGSSWIKSPSHAPRQPRLSQLYFRGSTCLHVPYDSNSDEDDIYYVRHETGDNLDGGKLYRVKDGAETNITPNYDGSQAWVVARSRWGLMTAPTDRTRVAGIFQTQFKNLSLFTSTNEGDAWTVRDTSGNYARVAISGDNSSVLYLWGVNGHIAYSSDFGVTIQDKRGNMTSFNPAPGELIGICGGPTS